MHNTKLHTLNLSHNELVSVSDLRGLESLFILDMANNNISNVSGDSLISAPSLSHLVLHHNQIVSVNNMNETNLVTLDLSYNLLDSIPALPQSLTHLNLSYNNISNIVMSQNCATSLQLTHLDLSHNPIEHLTNDQLSGLDTLISLKLVSTLLTSVPSIPSLQMLDLSRTLIPKLEAEDLKEMVLMTNLTIAHCSKLASIESGAFSNMSLLICLNVSHNPELSAWDPDTLDDLQYLSDLDIHANNLKTVLIPFLPSLQRINVANNPWICDCRLMEMQNMLQQLPSTSMASCHLPRHLSDKLITDVIIHPCDSHSSQEFSDETHDLENQYHYFYLFISIACLSIVLLILIINRRRLTDTITEYRY